MSYQPATWWQTDYIRHITPWRGQYFTLAYDRYRVFVRLCLPCLQYHNAIVRRISRNTASNQQTTFILKKVQHGRKPRAPVSVMFVSDREDCFRRPHRYICRNFERPLLKHGWIAFGHSGSIYRTKLRQTTNSSLFLHTRQFNNTPGNLVALIYYVAHSYWQTQRMLE